MKTWLVAPIAVFGLILGAVAQDPPGQSSETVAKPKKKADPNATTDPSATPPDSSSDNLPKIPSKLGNKAKDEGTPDVSFKADSSVVSVDVAILDNKGNPIPKIPRDNFRILEDNVPQKLSQYATTQAPLTVAMVIEFSARYQQYWSMGWRDTLNASYGFVQTLRPDDYLAVIAYDLRTDILSDFTNDHGKIGEALGRLRIPGFSESNMFDALAETADRMQKIEGRKAILIITSGIDTFSKLTYDKTRKALQESAVPVYSIGILQFARTMAGVARHAQRRAGCHVPAGR